jgi:hypothetical protein
MHTKRSIVVMYLLLIGGIGSTALAQTTPTIEAPVRVQYLRIDLASDSYIYLQFTGDSLLRLAKTPAELATSAPVHTKNALGGTARDNNGMVYESLTYHFPEIILPVVDGKKNSIWQQARAQFTLCHSSSFRVAEDRKEMLIASTYHVTGNLLLERKAPDGAQWLYAVNFSAATSTEAPEGAVLVLPMRLTPSIITSVRADGKLGVGIRSSADNVYISSITRNGEEMPAEIIITQADGNVPVANEKSKLARFGLGMDLATPGGGTINPFYTVQVTKPGWYRCQIKVDLGPLGGNVTVFGRAYVTEQDLPSIPEISAPIPTGE